MDGSQAQYHNSNARSQFGDNQDNVLSHNAGNVTPNNDPSHANHTVHPTIGSPTVSEVFEMVIDAFFDNNQCKHALKAMKIFGAHNAKLDTKRKVIAQKLVQKHIKIKELNDLIAFNAANDSNIIGSRQIPSTAVRIRRAEDKSGVIEYIRGDAPTTFMENM
ncbi:hypothetical protein BWQ96_05801 [Gracilariopsis chorda]|uniref:Uncharacterized protein n=1 Tax=Gracilariopsis chorda TaxID=448386 RepID=A0A2V3IQP2_9FLOR|nr:hypothetical protein BWQ96_05801 [Gracilariopsis chorda]|eukprot:PXF44431.1 hypothetical protein BWQ96_05801 [Gracilariopsis chorda]